MLPGVAALPSPPTSASSPDSRSVAIPWLIPALLSAALVLWAMSRIVPDVLAHTHGRLADAHVTRMATKQSVVWLDFEARTADAGVIRGSDMLHTRWPPGVGDRVEIVYLAAGDWRHAILASDDRDWLNALLMRWIALFFGVFLAAAALATRYGPVDAARAPGAATAP